MHINIEPVKPGEVQLLAEISRITFYDTFHAQNLEEDMKMFLEESFNVTKLETELQDASNHFFFARIENEVVGYVKLISGKTPVELEATNAIEIARIYSITQKIGSGVGKALLQFAIAFAKASGKQTIWLGVWEHNDRAINFYTRFGFQKFGEHIFKLGNDAQTDWLMKKDLSD